MTGLNRCILMFNLFIFACVSGYGQVKIVRPKFFPQIENSSYLRRCFPVEQPKSADGTTFIYNNKLTKAQYFISKKECVCQFLYIVDSLHPLPNGIRVGQSYLKVASILKIKLNKAPKTIEITFGEKIYRILTLSFSKNGKCSKIDFDVTFPDDVD